MLLAICAQTFPKSATVCIANVIYMGKNKGAFHPDYYLHLKSSYDSKAHIPPAFAFAFPTQCK